MKLRLVVRTSAPLKDQHPSKENHTYASTEDGRRGSVLNKQQGTGCMAVTRARRCPQLDKSGRPVFSSMMLPCVLGGVDGAADADRELEPPAAKRRKLEEPQPDFPVLDDLVLACEGLLEISSQASPLDLRTPQNMVERDASPLWTAVEEDLTATDSAEQLSCDSSTPTQEDETDDHLYTPSPPPIKRGRRKREQQRQQQEASNTVDDAVVKISSMTIRVPDAVQHLFGSTLNREEKTARAKAARLATRQYPTVDRLVALPLIQGRTQITFHRPHA